jgi:hypothetical protein
MPTMLPRMANSNEPDEPSKQPVVASGTTVVLVPGTSGAPTPKEGNQLEADLVCTCSY